MVTGKEKIKIMSQLALLEKKGIRKDFQITKYYVEDYIYTKNFKTRIGVFLIVAVACFVHLLSTFETEIFVPTTKLDLFLHYILPYGGVVLIVLFIYTLLSTQVYKRVYYGAEQRVMRYRALLKALDNIDQMDKIEESKVWRGRNGKRKAINLEE